MMVTLVERDPELPKQPAETLSKKYCGQIWMKACFFEISSAADQVPIVAFDVELATPTPPKKQEPVAEDKSKTGSN